MPGLLKKLRENPTILSTIGLLALATASWLRFAWTHNLRVDENFVSGSQAAILIPLVLVGLALATAASLLGTSRKLPGGLALFTSLTALSMPPFLSNDVFSYFYYGEALAKGLPVYHDFQGQHLFWHQFVGRRYLDTPAVYGLPLLLLYAAITQMAGSHTFWALFILKTIHGMAAFVVWKTLCERVYSPRQAVWMVALPLFWLEGLANLHNEFLLLPLAFGGILLYQNGRLLPAVLLWALAAWCKYSFALLLLWPWLDQPLRRSWPRLMGVYLASLLMMGTLHIMIWKLIYPGGPPWDGLLRPWATVSSLGPSSSLTDVVFTLTRVFLNADLASFLNRVLGSLLQIFSVGLGIILLRHPQHRQPPVGLWMLGAIFISFFSHRIMAWYFLILLPFWWEGLPPVWRRWFLVTSAVYSAQGLIQYTPPEWLFTQALTATLVVTGVYLLFWKFKSRYFSGSVSPSKA
ncbi:MAG: hypothetical protein NZM65_07905 [Flavobacteriales bacterium]|nr:hypothetical protein [Flavobacteriales bacterium]MDW8410596.1 hypothetical protein [Flavobacteriales bacterium]